MRYSLRPLVAGNGSLLAWFSAAACCVLLCACTIVDSTLPSRGYAVNVGSGNLREDVLLLNIVRASRFEPMNFVTLSKYNASGTLEAGVQGTRNDGIIYDILNKGPIAAGTTATGVVVRNVMTPNVRANQTANFDLAPLENKEFYAGLLAQIGLEQISILVNAGLSRELVLHSIVKSARVQHINGQFHQFHNDPTNDAWERVNDEASHRRCLELRREGAFERAFAHPVWSGAHANDCNYQKFLLFLRGAVELGMTAEAATAGSGKKASGAKNGDGSAKIEICYDPAIAREYGREVPRGYECPSARDGAPVVRRPGALGVAIRQVQPVLRSPYAVFQYYGRILGTDTAGRVHLIDAGTPRLPTGDKRILTIKRGGADLERCFASATHAGDFWCVPNEGANNTKEIFVLLNALVNLATTRTSLPVTPTVQVAP